MYQFTRNITLLIALFLGGNYSFSQNFSMKGKEFIFPNLTTFYITTESHATTIIFKDFDSGDSDTILVSADTSIVFGGPLTGSYSTFNSVPSITPHKNIIITSDFPIFLQIKRFVSIYPVIPTDYATDYQTITSHRTKNTSSTIASPIYISIIITSIHDSNVIDITPSQDLSMLIGWLANNTYTVTLNRGESITLSAKECVVPTNCLLLNKNQDLSGTIIKSRDICKKFNSLNYTFGKISGEINLPPQTTSAHMFEMQMPDKYVKNTYYVLPTKNNILGDLFKIYSHKNNTHVFINNAYATTLAKNETFDTLLNIPSKITSNHTIFLSHYYRTSSSPTDTTSPELIIVYPDEYRAKKFKINDLFPVGGIKRYLKIYTETSNISSFTLDGLPVSSTQFSPFAANPAMSFAYIKFSAGYHNLESTATFQSYAEYI